MKRRAVFLDRDGVLIRDVGLLAQTDQIELLPSAATAVRRLRESGFALIVVTNQPVVARGLATEKQVESVHESIQQALSEKGGERVDQFYTCPHHPEASLSRYRLLCDCRKPRPGMLVQAACDWDLDLENSFMIGDRISDVAAGSGAGCATVLVTTGKHDEAPIVAPGFCYDGVEPDHICADIGDAAGWIMENQS